LSTVGHIKLLNYALVHKIMVIYFR